MSEIVENENINSVEQATSESVVRRPERHHRKPENQKGGFYKLRQIFNVIFMIGAVIGAFVYWKDETMGAVIIITAMAFKMAECVLRFKK